MIDHRQIEPLIQAALLADSYCLGMHWIYDQALLDSAPQPVDRLNPPLSHWHGTKQAGDLTHYGDQLWHLYQHLQRHRTLEIDQYRREWADFMDSYHGFIDRASATTLEHIRKQQPCSSASTELSVSCRIACPLLYAESEEAFFEDVEQLTRLTHDSPAAVEVCLFFARILLDTLRGRELTDAVTQHLELLSDALQHKARQGIDSANEETRPVLRQFGIACDIRHGLPGVMHLIHRYSDPLPMLQENALAGGDSSARGMISLMLLVAADAERLKSLPADWLATIFNSKQKN